LVDDPWEGKVEMSNITTNTCHSQQLSSWKILRMGKLQCKAVTIMWRKWG